MVMICGPANMENDLISRVISRELATSCRIVEETKIVESSGGTAGTPDPNLVLIDAVGDGYDSVLQRLQKQNGERRCEPFWAIYNVKRDTKIDAATLRHGVRGIFYAKDSLPLFVKGVRTLLEGGFWVSKRTLLELTLDDSKYRAEAAMELAGLTHREVEVLAHLSRGETNQKIADLLCVSPHTVKSHLNSAYRKIKVNNRFQASLWAAEQLR